MYGCNPWKKCVEIHSKNWPKYGPNRSSGFRAIDGGRKQTDRHTHPQKPLSRIPEVLKRVDPSKSGGRIFSVITILPQIVHRSSAGFHNWTQWTVKPVEQGMQNAICVYGFHVNFTSTQNFIGCMQCELRQSHIHIWRFAFRVLRASLMPSSFCILNAAAPCWMLRLKTPRYKKIYFHKHKFGSFFFIIFLKWKFLFLNKFLKIKIWN